jgi:hypoxanthine phosphoribosyltransferase
MAAPPRIAGRTVGSHPGRVPARWQAELRDVLITEAQIKRRVATLARTLTRDYAGSELTVVALLTGTVVFLADLLRRLEIPLQLDFMGVSSYGTGTESGQLVYTKKLRLGIEDREVLLVDDILDTGRTLADVTARLRRLRPRSLRTCVLLDKPSRRLVPITADYTGFVIPDVFVVGYGLDFAERHRNLPFLGVLRQPSAHGRPAARNPSPPA